MIARLQASLSAWRRRLGEFWWYSALMLVVQPLSIPVNFYTGVILIPRLVPPEKLGAILPYVQVAAFLGVPLGLLMTPFGKYLNTFLARGELGKAKSLLADTGRLAVIVGGLMAVLTAVVAQPLLVRMHLAGATLTAMLCVMAFVGGVKPVILSAAQALKRFDNMLFGGLVSAPLRLALVFALAGPFGLTGYLGAMVLLEALLLLMPVYALAHLLGRKVPRESYRAHRGEMFAFSLPLLITGAVGSLAATVPPFVIRHRLPALDSAAYYMLTRFGEASAYMGYTMSALLFPLLSERHERGQQTDRLLRQATLATVCCGSVVVLFLAFGGRWILGLHEAWTPYRPYAAEMWRIGLIRLLETVTAGVWVHQVACRRFGFVWILTAVDALAAATLYGLSGWAFFRPWLPPGVWSFVDALQPCRLTFIVGFTLALQVLRGMLALALLRPGARARPDAAPPTRRNPGDT